MEEERMILRDLPVDTRNYTIVDNITGKPIDQSTYTLTIDKEVIAKLNKLKELNEEKIKQAALRDKYGNSDYVSTFTPQDNAVFTPVYNDEYISYHDFNDDKKEETYTAVQENTITDIPSEETTENVVDIDTNSQHAEVIQSDSILERVVARDPSLRVVEEEKPVEEPKEELDYISNYTGDNVDTSQNENQELQADNSLFTPEMATLQDASEQILKIDTEKLGEDIKAHKEQKRGTEKIKLDKMEIISGKKIAWTAYILFFIPLLFRKNNRFVRLHANEGVELNIVELLSGLFIGQYFLLPTLIENLSGTLSTISFFAGIIGAGLLGACILTLIPMMICAMCGLQVQTPWLWHRRIIKVPTERTSDM